MLNTSTGLLFSDVPVALFAAYVFWGGFLVTIAGLAFSVAAAIDRKSWQPLLGTMLTLGAPALYFAAWQWLEVSNLPSPPASDVLFMTVLVAFGMCVFVGPILALKVLALPASTRKTVV